jgi:Haemolymph juvenile hormone binding protein (JHBP)
LLQAIDESAKLMEKGIPSLNIPSIEPLEIDNVVLNHGTNNSRFNLRSSFKDVKIFGLASSKLNRTAIKFDKFRLKSEIYTERLDFAGNYEMNGMIIFLPIEGRGKANISMHQLSSRHELFGDYFTKPDGETYINITDYKITFKPKRVTFKFENLFNGDKILGEEMNKFMNQQWKAVFNGLVPEYSRFFGQKFQSIANNVFGNIPMKEIFLE